MDQRLKLFINYRREDHAEYASALRTHLIHRYGRDNVFMDLEIPRFTAFETVIRAKISESHAVLAIIGPVWLKTLQERQLLDETDYVQLELELALEQGKPILPICIASANPPAGRVLPSSLRPAFALHAEYFPTLRVLDDTVSDMMNDLERVLATPMTAPVPPSIPLQSVKPAPKGDTRAIEAIMGGPFEWCRVGGGPFWMGSDRRKDKQTYDQEPEIHQLELPTFWVGKHTVTYHQFQAFIDAQDGYLDDRWWAGLAVEPDHRAQQGDQKWKIADHPRERVSWYDSMAFCRWLSYRLGGGYDLGRMDDWLVRLPTEAEWEKAARGTDRRIYPWGDHFDKSKANTSESGLKKTEPVTAYPAGASPYGALNMSGNVWEWCLNEWTNPYQHLLFMEINYINSNNRLLRGGSCFNLSRWARAACRSYWDPFGRNLYVGFRLVSSVPITP